MAAVVVHAEREDRYWYPHDGGVVWLAGYQLVDPESGRWLGRDDPRLAERGLHVAGIAGAGQFHDDVLQSEALEPGRPLVLRRDAANEHDPNAIAVDTPDGAHAGFVPREVAADVAPELDSGTAWAAVVLRERRASPRDPRTGATMLLARGDAVTLRG